MAVPAIHGRPAPDFLFPFFVRHGDHSHAVTAPLFPLATAPLLWMFGLRGAYALPFIAYAAVLVGCGLLSRRLGIAPPTLAIVAVALCSPLVFYALEYWEHVPAMAAGAWALLLLISARGWLSAFWGGVLLAITIQLRPEAVWFSATALAVTAATAGRTRPAVAALGLAAGMIPITAYNLRHFGTLGGLHVSANLAALGAGWVASRLTFARTWLGPADSGVAQAALLLLCFGLLRVEARAARWSAYAGVTLLSVAALTRALPRQSLWGTAPFLATAFLPDGQAAPRTRGLLLLMAAGIVIGVLATAPNDGGAQWGPRYLLLAAMPLALLAADGTRAAWTRRGIDGWAGRLAVVAAFGAAVATTRAGYRDLRSSKRDYAQLAFAIQDATKDVPYLVSNVWWVDQISAGTRPRTTFLYASDSGRARAALSLTAPDPVLAVTSREAELATAVRDWLTDSCYHIAGESTVRVGSVTLHTLECGIARRD